MKNKTMYHRTKMGKAITIATMCMMFFSVFAVPAFAASKSTVGYKTPNGKIVEATCAKEKVVGGRPGDQSGKECKLSRYSYKKGAKHGHGWKFVIRCTDPAVADRAAYFAKAVSKNNNIGYNNYVNNQKGIDQRNSLYLEAKKVGFDASKITKKTDTSCTPLALVGFRAAGINMDYKVRCKYKCRKTGKYTGTYLCGTVNAESLKGAINVVNRNYIKQGKPAPFKIIYPTKKQFKKYKKYLKRGDIVCTGKHTAIVQ